MTIREEVYKAYKDHINSHMEENRDGAARMKEALEHSPLFWNGTVDKTVHIPKVYDEETISRFGEIARITHGIFSKVINEYLRAEDFRALFPFPKEMEELILIPATHEGALPMARFDIFYNEETGDFKFCEINTDGTAAQLRDLELGKALINNPAHQAVIREFDMHQFELFDTWVSEFLDLYRKWPAHRDCPNVAIVDILDNATLRDFEEFTRRFQKQGANCEICDVRRMTYKDGVLYSATGNRIDAIYRRAVTADVMEYYDQVGDFLNAVRDGDVFMAGSFSTQVIHSKWLFYVLHHERTKSILTAEENDFVKRHIPLTVEFGPKFISLEEVQANKDDYMIKPMDAYASKGAYAAGREYSDEEWKKVTEELYGQGLICQEYCKQYLTDNIDFAWGDGTWHPYINMPGLYVYNGKFSGFLMRMACDEKIIVAHENERTAPVFVVTGRKS